MNPNLQVMFDSSYCRQVGNGKVVKAAAGVELPKITGAAPQYGQELITVVEETEAGPSGHTDTWDTQQFS